MAALSVITRFSADPSATAEILHRRAELIATVRASYPGLGETRLGKLDDTTWVDQWRWDSAEALETVAAAQLPEAAAAFALVTNPVSERVEIVDER